MATTTTQSMPSRSEEIYDAVRVRYSAASQGTKDGRYESTVAKAFGYSDEELASIPEGANLGLSCGNPFGIAAIKEGETVVDLGCGAGFDIFQALPKVGKTGQAIGVDMNDDMLARARKNAATIPSASTNTKFINSRITAIPDLADGSADCMISNCVINLVPEEEKHLVFEEMYRILKPGGRVAVSDILLKSDLPDGLQRNMALYVGCVAGASKVEAYEKYLKEAGFGDILIVDNQKNLNIYNEDDGSGSAPSAGGESCCGAPSEKVADGNNVKDDSDELEGVDFNAYAGSYNIFAVKSQSEKSTVSHTVT